MCRSVPGREHLFCGSVSGDNLPPVGQTEHGVMKMHYDDPKMQAYFNDLPAKARAMIDRSGVEISTPGELMLVGEHFRKKFAEESPTAKPGS